MATTPKTKKKSARKPKAAPKTAKSATETDAVADAAAKKATPAKAATQQPKQAPKTEETAQQPRTVTYSMSPGLVPWLARSKGVLALTSYQSGKFYLIGRNPKGGLLVDERLFQHAMGIAVDGKRLILATQASLVEMVSSLASSQRANEIYDACFVPRRVHITGTLDAHDVGIDKQGKPVFVATGYNCLAQLSETHNLKPIWKPSFVSKIIGEDRCHLNGLAMEDGEPAYVTAVSKSDTIDGWRDRRYEGGVLIDVKTNKVLAKGLSMPHSPRVHQGQLYVLNSGTGGLLRVDRSTGETEEIAFCPGFVRGLSFHNDFAIVGLSRPRYKRFEGLALDQRLADADSEPWTGIQIINLKTGAVAEWFRIDGAIAEVYDTGFVPDVTCAMSLSLGAGELARFITVEDNKI
ncbi:MAG: TIGR03032 family protein [Pikeienuella sp.]